MERGGERRAQQVHLGSTPGGVPGRFGPDSGLPSRVPGATRSTTRLVAEVSARGAAGSPDVLGRSSHGDKETPGNGQSPTRTGGQ